ncbi:hypothetical protein [Pseudomonas aeruginosa]|uniref:hypothetical protein n=1 Tax=Pseudomonas aeruginosa TaxID=287 RepID=UPI000C340BE3|nr:hypothetical protein [Pseudomonas aeruginosa]PKG15089.1 hypothetical protein CVS50_32940 [Pseudomonas aeruginosa]
MTKHPSGSAVTATTAPRHLVALAIVGGALIAFQVNKTDATRASLQSVTDMARRLGQLNDQDVSVVAELLASPVRTAEPAIPLGERPYV